MLGLSWIENEEDSILIRESPLKHGKFHPEFQECSLLFVASSGQFYLLTSYRYEEEEVMQRGYTFHKTSSQVFTLSLSL